MQDLTGYDSASSGTAGPWGPGLNIGAGCQQILLTSAQEELLAAMKGQLVPIPPRGTCSLERWLNFPWTDVVE